MIAHKQLTLSNGTRVILVPHRDTSATTLLALYEVGSRYEDRRLSGASHYIEHMMFKGTERRPTTRDISRDLDSVGADYNAFTSKDYTGYYIRLQSEKFPLAADMLEDMLYHSAYRQKDLDAERNVILEEIRMYEDNPVMYVEEIMEEELYRGSTLGWRISGTVETMKGIGRQGLVAYRDRYYVPQRTVLSLAGKFDEKEAVAMLEAKFGSRPKARDPKPFARFSIAEARYRGPRVKIHKKETEQVQLAIGFPAYPHGDPRLPALQVLSTILGGTMSSRLFMSVREREGLAYSIHSYVNPFQDVGGFVVQSGLAKDRLDKAIRIIMRELAAIKKNPVTTEELRRAQEYTKGKMLLALEDSSRMAEWFAKQELLKKKITDPQEWLAKIFAVTKDDVRRAASDVFRAARMTIAVIGPYGDEKPFARQADALR